MKHVVQFSGGLCSFWAAHRVIAEHGKENLTLTMLRERIEAGEDFDRNDWGGCGCSSQP